MITQDDTKESDLPAILSSGLKVLELPLPEATQSALIQYVDLLQRWNRTYNLTAIREPGRMVSHHLLDSLAVIGPLKNRMPGLAGVVDVGSGGGLPGIVLALVWPDRPVVLVEPVSKKCAFLRQCASELGLRNLTVLEQRIQHVLPAELPAANCLPNLFISRAYTRLGAFAAQVLPLCTNGSLVVAMKSALVGEEVSEICENHLIRTIKNDTGSTQIQLKLIGVEDLSVPGVDAPRSLVLLRAQSDARLSRGLA